MEVRKFNSNRKVNGKGHKMIVSFLRREYSFLPGLLVLAVASLLQFVIEFRMHGINHHNPFQIAIVHDRSPIWFVGTMLGSFVSGPNAYTWPARKCYLIFGIILFVISVLLIFFDYWSDPMQAIAIYEIFKTISGFSFGFIQNVLICHIADNVTKHHRGCVVLNISFYLIALPSILSLVDFNMFIISAIAFVSIVLAWFYCRNPMTYHLKFNRTSEAERVFIETNEKSGEDSVHLRNEIEEMKNSFHEENNEQNIRCYLDVFSDGNWRPMISISLLWLLSAMVSLLSDAFFSISSYNNNNSRLMLIQLVALCISKSSIDKIGRRPLFIISSVCSILIALIQIILVHCLDVVALNDISWAMHQVFLFTYHLGIEPLTNVYACEAFSLSKRNISLTIVNIVQYSASIIMIWSYAYRNFVSLIAINSVLALFLIFRLPETKQLSLGQSRNKFNNHYEHFQPSPTAPVV